MKKTWRKTNYPPILRNFYIVDMLKHKSCLRLGAEGLDLPSSLATNLINYNRDKKAAF